MRVQVEEITRAEAQRTRMGAILKVLWEHKKHVDGYKPNRVK